MQALGSAPREAGAFMLIGPDETIGTIGGGHLEFMVIDMARKMLRDGTASDTLDVPLGPEIGQCCGGRVKLDLALLDGAKRADLLDELLKDEADSPHVYLFGAGHVGRALAAALGALPLHVHLIDTRPDALEGLPDAVDTQAVPLPEAVVRKAPGSSAFVILTHDHALDFLIVREALEHPSARYVGMIGSKTKRAQFKRWYMQEGGREEDFARLICPIGRDKVADKRPEVIAALAAAEILVHTFGSGEREGSGGRNLADVSGGANVR
jgi:xanthine dehydrogenase accessory factor